MIRKNRGFTVLELVVVMGIVAVFSAVAVPNLQAWMANSRLTNSSRAVQSALQLARVSAIKEQSPVMVTFKEGTGDNASVTISVPDDGQVLKIIQMGKGVTLEQASFPQATDKNVIFDARGLTTDYSGAVRVKNSLGTSLTITLTGAGSSEIVKK